jgi:hypothetical protein
MVLSQPIEGEGAAATDAEIMHALFRLDELFDAGIIGPAHWPRLSGILAQSPWKKDAGILALCRDVRRKEGYGRERFWWWPETW